MMMILMMVFVDDDDDGIVYETIVEGDDEFDTKNSEMQHGMRVDDFNT